MVRVPASLATTFMIVSGFLLRRFAYAGKSRVSAVGEPVLPPGIWMLAQVPCPTNFQELPWKSMVDVPWQVVPGPAAQSFCPFSATPKHFSLPAATAALPSASVKGAAAAIDASALVTAPASKSELTVDFTDMSFSMWVFVSVPPLARFQRFVRVDVVLRNLTLTV
jgi:hypothetical protein